MEKMNVVITKSELNAFTNKLIILNKKLKSFDSEVVITNMETIYPKTSIGNVELKITLDTPKFNFKKDCEFVARIEFTNDNPLVFSFGSDIELDTTNVKSKMNCDHCNTTRVRNSYIVVKENNELKYIGSTCSEKYLGIDVNSALALYDSFIVESEDELRFRKPNFVSLHTLVRTVAFFTKDFKGLWEKGDTSNFVKNALSNSECWSETIDTDLAIKNLYEDYSNPKNSFEHNIANTLPKQDSNDMYVEIKYCGITAYGLYASNHERKEKVETIESNFIGAINDKTTIEAEYIDVVYFDGYAYGTTTCIYTFKDNQGNIITVKTSDTTKIAEYLDEKRPFNQMFKLTGTIKEHKVDFKNRNTTVLSRAKLS